MIYEDDEPDPRYSGWVPFGEMAWRLDVGSMARVVSDLDGSNPKREVSVSVDSQYLSGGFGPPDTKAVVATVPRKNLRAADH